MPKRKFPFVPGQFYHIYTRGNNKQQIFFNKEDYQKFIKYLYICNSVRDFKFRDDIVGAKIDAFNFDRVERLVSIGSWALMPNHIHLYLTINPDSHTSDVWKNEGKNEISEFMRKLLTSYVKYINEKHERTGGLFEGNFKAEIMKSDSQAKYLFSYIHLNPVKLIDPRWREEGVKDINKVLNFLENYEWSSYQDYSGVERPENKIIDSEDLPIDFRNPEEFDREIISWLKYNRE